MKPGPGAHHAVFLLELFPRLCWKGCALPPCPPKVIPGWRQEKTGTRGGPTAKSFKGNQAFGWQDHCFHICSFRILCCYSTYCDLDWPLPSAKAPSPRPGQHLATTEPAPASGQAAALTGAGLFLALMRLGQAAGWRFCTGTGGGGWMGEGVVLSEMGIWSSLMATVTP